MYSDMKLLFAGSLIWSAVWLMWLDKRPEINIKMKISAKVNGILTVELHLSCNIKLCNVHELK